MSCCISVAEPIRITRNPNADSTGVHVTHALLENSNVYPVQELRLAWNVLDFDLSRTDPSSDVQIDGKYVLQSVLGSQVEPLRDP